MKEALDRISWEIIGLVVLNAERSDSMPIVDCVTPKTEAFWHQNWDKVGRIRVCTFQVGWETPRSTLTLSITSKPSLSI